MAAAAPDSLPITCGKRGDGNDDVMSSGNKQLRDGKGTFGARVGYSISLCSLLLLLTDPLALP